MAESWTPKDDYSPSNHNHDTKYAPSGHNHDNAYAAKSHNHDTVYSKLNHVHDYASKDHNHDTVYSKLSHTHSTYALTSHKHDNAYSKLNHLHDFDMLSGLAPDYAYITTMVGFIPETEWSSHVFHIKVPGYFYVSSDRLAIDTDVAVVCSNSADNLINLPADVNNGGTTYNSKCVLWHGISHADDYGDNSYIWPIFIPGNSTYVRFVYGSTSDEYSVRLCFIPCKYVTKKDPYAEFYKAIECGTDNDKAFGNSQDIGTALTRALASTIFGGDWTSLHTNM